MEMHKDFAAWYKTVDLEESIERLEKRWSGIEEIVKTASPEVIESLLAIAQKRSSNADEDSIASVRNQFTEADPFFDQSGNDAEMRVLSEAALVQIIEQSAKTSLRTDAALFLAAALCDQDLYDGGVTNLHDRLNSVLDALSEAARRRNDVAIQKPSKLEINLDDAFEGLDNFDDINLFKAFITTFKGNIEEGINAAVASAHKNNLALWKQLRFQDEELDMLWWASNQYSTTRGILFKKLGDGERGLVAGEELAGLTLFKPGPLSVASLLTKAGVKPSKKVSIPEAVNACDTDWLKSIMQDLAPTVFQPIHLAVKKKLETMDDTSWISAWLSMTGLPKQPSFPETELARLFYLERLVLNCSGCD